MRLAAPLAFVTAALATLAPPHAGFAQTPDAPIPIPGTPRVYTSAPSSSPLGDILDLDSWSFQAGALAIVQPTFEGAESMGVLPFPLLSAQYEDRFTLDSQGVSLTYFKWGPAAFKALAGYDLGRSEGADDHLDGLGDIGPSARLGLGVDVTVGPAVLRAEAYKSLGGDNGWIGELGAAASHEVLPRLILDADASLTFADSDHMETFFGVDAGQSARSGLARHDAEAGLKRMDLELGATYGITEHWFVRSQVGLGLLVGDAADSPVTQNAFQPSAMIGGGYRF